MFGSFGVLFFPMPQNTETGTINHCEPSTALLPPLSSVCSCLPVGTPTFNGKRSHAQMHKQTLAQSQHRNAKRRVLFSRYIAEEVKTLATLAMYVHNTCSTTWERRRTWHERKAEDRETVGKAGTLFQKNEKWSQRRRAGERGEEESDSFFNIRLAGDVFLHSSVCLCVYFPVAVSFTALGISQLSTDHQRKSWLTDGGAVERPRPLSV